MSPRTRRRLRAAGRGKSRRASSPTAIEHGAKKSEACSTCAKASRAKALLAIQCGAFHLQTAGRRYFNTTPLGRAVTATAIAKAMKEDDVHVFSDGFDAQGQRHPAVLSLRQSLVDPELA